MIRATLLLIFFLCICSCNAAVSSDGDLYMMTGAYGFEKTILKNDNATQYKYNIDKKYPDESVLVEIEKRLLSKNFISCKKLQGWMDFDSKVDDDRYIKIKQNIAYFYNKNLKKIVLVSLRYYSDSQRKKVNDNQQEVLVVVYQMESIEDMKVTLSEISCE